MLYRIVAQVDQIVTKEVDLLVEAKSEDEAQDKARDILQTYPEATKTPGVRRVLTTKARYWIPKSVEFTTTKPVRESTL